jgi:hypothetical protein
MIRHFRAGETNHCPGCGRAQWLVGRITTECVFCHTALPLADQHAAPSRPILRIGNGGGKVSRMQPATA